MATHGGQILPKFVMPAARVTFTEGVRYVNYRLRYRYNTGQVETHHNVGYTVYTDPAGAQL